jgi:3-dehydroquinate synthase
MLLDARYSVEAGLMDEDALEAISTLVDRLGLPRWDDALALRAPDGSPRILEGLAEFREHLGGELTITLLEGIGRGVDAHVVEDAFVARAVEWLRDRRARR